MRFCWGFGGGWVYTRGLALDVDYGPEDVSLRGLKEMVTMTGGLVMVSMFNEGRLLSF